MSLYKSMMAGFDPLMAGIVFEEDGGGGGEGGGDGGDGGQEGGDGGDDGGDNGSGGDGGEGGGDTGWRDSITDESHKAIAARFNSPTDAIKAVSDLRKQVSTSIRVPGADAKPEEIAKFNKALGVPDSPEGYQFKMPDGRDATEGEKAFQGNLAKIFHAAGINATAAGKLNDLWNEMGAANEQAVADADKQYVEESRAALTKKWGKDMERNTNLSNRAAAYLFGDNMEAATQIEMKDGRFLLDHPVIMEALAKAGVEMDEDGFQRMDPQGQEDMKSEHADLTRQIADAQNSGDSKKAQELSDKRAELSRKMTGGK